MENEIVFVTHNKGKAKSAEKYFKNMKISTYEYELDEPRSDDIQEIATAKVKQAYEVVKKPCMAMDAFSLETLGIKGVLKLMEDKENRKCSFNECLAYYDGKKIKYFYGKHLRKFVKRN